MSENEPPPDSNGPEQGLREVVNRFVEALRSDASPDRAEWVARHPELAPDLEYCLMRIETAFRAALEESGGTDPNWEDIATAAFPVFPERRSVGPSDKTDPLNDETQAATSADRLRGEQSVGIRCPHCGQRIQVAVADDTEITCGGCGSSFHFDSAIATGARESQLPTHVGRFEDLERLGRGGFGVVYKAWDPLLSRFVAIKMPRAGYFATSEDEQRFLREARSAARLRHPHIVRIFEIDREHGVPYIVSEFIEGTTLADLLARQRLSFRESAEIVVQVAGALEYAHQERVIHRDIKPSNILLDNTWHAYVADFGLARRDDAEFTITIEGQVLGTPAYMAPEQAAGDHSRVDRRSDVYSLGTVLYHATCGELPFRGSRRMLVNQVIHDEPRPPRRINEHIPKDLETITLKAIAKESNRRYASSREFADDLRRWLNDEPIHARPVGAVERVTRWCRRNRTVAFLAATIVLMLISMAVGASVWALREAALYEQAGAARDQAVENEAISRNRLVRIHLQNGDQQMGAGELLPSLLWFCEAMRVDSGNRPISENHRLRIGMMMDRFPTLVRLWHRSKGVRHAEFSPDSSRVLAASDDGSLVVWDVRNGTVVVPEMHHDEAVTFATFDSAGSRIVATGRATTAYLWDANTGQQVAQLDHGRQPVDAAFSPDARFVATASLDGKARVWDARSGTLVTELDHPDSIVTRVAFAPDSSKLLTASRILSSSKGELRVFLAESGEPVGQVMHHDAYIRHALFAAGGSQIISSSDDRTVRIWDARTGAPVGQPLLHDNPVFRAFLIPETGRLISATVDGHIRIWETATGELVSATIDHGSVLVDVQLSESGIFLATAGVDGKTRVWSWASATQVTPPLPHSGLVTAIAFDSTDRRILTASEDGTVKLWDIASAVPAPLLLAHEGPVTCATYCPDGTRVLTTSRDHTARIWAAESAIPLGDPMGHDADVLSGTFSPDGELAATASVDRTAQIWDGHSGRPMGPRLNHSDVVLHLAFSPGNNLLATASKDGSAKVWNTRTRKLLFSLHHKASIRCVVFSPDARWIATASMDATARIWQAADGAPHGNPLHHEDAVMYCAFSPDSRILVTTSRDHTAVAWNVATGKPVHSPLYHPATVSSVGFGRDGNRFLTGDLHGNTRVWDLNFLDSPVWILSQGDSSVDDAHFGPHDHIAASAVNAYQNRDRDLRENDAAHLWDVDAGVSLSTPFQHPGSVNTVCFNPDGDALLTACNDHAARIWNLPSANQPNEDLMQLAELFLGRRIDRRTNLVAIDASTLRDQFETLRTKYPDLFRISQRDLAAWKQFAAQQAKLAAIVVPTK